MQLMMAQRSVLTTMKRWKKLKRDSHHEEKNPSTSIIRFMSFQDHEKERIPIISNTCYVLLTQERLGKLAEV
jgi:hypothetical protein